MGNLLKDLKRYLKDTPYDVIEKDMKDLDEYNKTGPDMLDILPDQNVKTDECYLYDILGLKEKIETLEGFIERMKDRDNLASYHIIIEVPDILIPDVIELAERKLANLKSELSRYTITKE